MPNQLPISDPLVVKLTTSDSYGLKSDSITGEVSEIPGPKWKLLIGSPSAPDFYLTTLSSGDTKEEAFVNAISRVQGMLFQLREMRQAHFLHDSYPISKQQ